MKFLKVFFISLAMLGSICLLAGCDAIGDTFHAHLHDYDTYDVCKECKFNLHETKLSEMELKFENQYGKLYFNAVDGTLAYQDLQSGIIAFTNPEQSESIDADVNTMSQLIISSGEKNDINTYRNSDFGAQAALSTAQVATGICLNYSITCDIQVPMMIEASVMEEQILIPLRDRLMGANSTNEEKRIYAAFNAYFSKKKYASETTPTKKDAVGNAYPICVEKNIDIYVYNSMPTDNERFKLSQWMAEYCPDFTVEDCKAAHAFVDFNDWDEKIVLQTALNFTVNDKGLTIDFAENYVDEAGNAYPLAGIDPQTGEEIVGRNGITLQNYVFFSHLKSLGLPCVKILV